MSGVNKNIVILISGGGSNMAAIVRAAQQQDWVGRHGVRVAAVLSNKADARGLTLAAAQGIATQVLDHKAYASREAFDAALAQAIDAYEPALVVLAGFMRILSQEFFGAFSGKLLNIHPSLLPAFKGMRTHAQALAAGVKVHGCTVHSVTPDLDHGPILAQAVVPVLAGDDENRLAERVLEMEHILYPMAIAAVLSGRCELRAHQWTDLGRGSFSHEFSPCIVHPSL